MYTCIYDDDLADIVKSRAQQENRSTRKQFIHYLKLALESERLLEENQDNKKADITRQDELSANLLIKGN
ncbi:hypothetical protein FQV37_2325 [Psychrobacter nivimaris]|uniref:Uncharacterized protein n=1 Tax=Psychrobacter nivimaris TaxID=281738 RepID=A0A6N7BTJ4_9GAMM|nr:MULTISPECIES: hypothetical protein [Psychrobacter]KAF0567379.1 hypothetical protein FQV37_2325 [Psychrobacter nivimaris]OEH66752.1 MAG: hypothetical protein BAX61_13175 [Psychrobacter sp. B29-1]